MLEESEPATTATLIEYRSETCEVHCYYKKGEAIQLIDDHIERALELQRQQQHQAGNGNHAGSVSPNAEKSKGKVNNIHFTRLNQAWRLKTIVFCSLFFVKTLLI